MKVRLVSILLLSIAAASGCAGSALPEPTTADANRGSTQFPDVTLAELQRGRSLYQSRCGSCHALKRPAELPAAQWQHEVSNMRENNGVKLSDAEARAIVRYLAIAASGG